MSDERVWIVTISEPLFYGAMYERILEATPESIAGVLILPDPTFQNLRQTLAEARYRLRFWGVRGFAVAVARRAVARLRRRGGVARMAARLGIPVVRADSLREGAEKLERAGATRALASVRFRVGARVLAALPGGWVNTHCAPLPRYAGIDAPFWCLHHGERELAVTLHYMTENFDEGPIIDQRYIANDGRPYFDLVDDLFRLASRMHVRYLRVAGPSFEEARPQDPDAGTYFGRPPVDAGRAFRRRGGRFA